MSCGALVVGVGNRLARCHTSEHVAAPLGPLLGGGAQCDVRWMEAIVSDFGEEDVVRRSRFRDYGSGRDNPMGVQNEQQKRPPKGLLCPLL